MLGKRYKERYRRPQTTKQNKNKKPTTERNFDKRNVKWVEAQYAFNVSLGLSKSVMGLTVDSWNGFGEGRYKDRIGCVTNASCVESTTLLYMSSQDTTNQMSPGRDYRNFGV